MDPPISPAPEGGADGDAAWYGNIQYLLNISAIGASCCVFIFLFVKLRSDHRRIPGPTALAAKLLAVWHATRREIASHCGADAAQFLLIEGGSCALLLSVAALSLLVMLPLNIYAGTAPLNDQFSKTTITHIAKGSLLLWVHFVFVVVVVVLVHFIMLGIEERLRITRFRDGNGNLSDPSANSTAIFTIMVQGLPKALGDDRTVLQEYFQYRYPGKVYRVILPMDLCALDDLAEELVRVRVCVPDIMYDSPRFNGSDLPVQDLSVYPVNRTSTTPKQTFDFAQYYAFNLTIFALTMIYSSFAPLVVPVGAVYFGYRYVVDKYNFLFVYRVRGFPAGNDGRLMDTVLGIMRFCVDLFLLSMLLFFSVQGDSTKLQAIFTLGLLVMYKLLPSSNDGFHPALLEGIQTVDNIVDGPIDYEVLSQPKFDWDTYHT
jgi:hypothetical protein